MEIHCIFLEQPFICFETVEFDKDFRLKANIASRLPCRVKDGKAWESAYRFAHAQMANFEPGEYFFRQSYNNKKKRNNKNKIKKYDFILLDECPLTKDSSISALGTLFNVLDA